MKTIFQLAKIARRAPRRKRGWQHKLKKAQTPKQREYCLGHIQLCERNMRIIEGELDRRNVNGPAYRDAETPRVKANRLFIEGLRAAIAKRNVAIVGAGNSIEPGLARLMMNQKL